MLVVVCMCVEMKKLCWFFDNGLTCLKNEGLRMNECFYYICFVEVVAMFECLMNNCEFIGIY